MVQLPLSFFTSFFGMNVREWSGQPTNLPIHTVGVLMGSISAALIVVALLLAFNKPIYQVVSYALQQGIKFPAIIRKPDSQVPRTELGYGKERNKWLRSRHDMGLPQRITTDGDTVPVLRKRNTG